MITFGSRNKLRAIAIRFELESFDNYTCFCPPLIPTPRSPTVLSITLLLHLYVSSPLGMNRVKSSMCIWFTTSFTLFWYMLQSIHSQPPYFRSIYNIRSDGTTKQNRLLRHLFNESFIQSSQYWLHSEWNLQQGYWDLFHLAEPLPESPYTDLPLMRK